MSIYAVPERSWIEIRLGYIRVWPSGAFIVSYSFYFSKFSAVLRLLYAWIGRQNQLSEREREREYLNRVRVWQFCFLLDQGTAIHFESRG